MSLIENFKDRVPTEVLQNGAIRYQQFDSNGNSLGYVYMLRADEPAEIGNIWNKSTYDGLKDELATKLNILDKASQAEAEGGTDDDKYMTALKVLQQINALALPSKQMSIKTGTITHNGTIPQTSGFSNYRYIVTPNNPQSYSKDYNSNTGSGFRMYCSVNQNTRKVTAYSEAYYYVNGNTNGWDGYATFTVDYCEIAWN